MYLKMDKDTKHMIEEISALSGIQRGIVREVWEFTLIKWVEQITKDPTKLQSLQIPFLGSVGVRYKNDVLDEKGSMEVEVDSFLALSSSFKQLVGDVYDERQNILTDILEDKMRAVIDKIVD